jgi:DNA-binding MarR family transcriptional regulator
MNKQREGGFLIAKIHQLGWRVFSKMLRARGVTELNPAQGRIMFVLWSEDHMSIQELARRTSLGKSTLTSMLDRLERSGYVRRVPGRNDRRVVLVERTELDKAMQAKYVAVSREMAEVFYRGFTQSETDQLEAYLRCIFDSLESARAAGD